MARFPVVLGSALALSLLMAAQAGAIAQATAVTRIRGTIESVEPNRIVVTSRDGRSIPVHLNDGWTISGLKRASRADIKPGTFVGVAATGPASETMHALEVLVFPPGVKSGEGHYGWDLLPESTMTNATVASTIEDVNGPVLTLQYPGGQARIAVEPDTPIVTFAPAEKADLKPGTAIFLSAQRNGDDTLSTSRVTVGNNGVAPPM